MENAPPPTPQSGNKLLPILVVLLVVAAFLIGSLYTQVNTLKKGGYTNTNSQAAPNTGNTGTTADAGQVAPTQGVAQIDVTGAPVLGKKDAKVALVEFTDYQCPFCGQLFTQTIPSIKKDYVDSGKVKYIVMDFPLFQIHPYAQKAAEASHCAEEQGKFWEYHDKLFNNQTALTVDDLKKYAGDLGLNASKFGSCLDDGKYKDLISKTTKAGEGYGVRGTPSSFVGIVSGNTVKDAVQVSGAVPFDQFKTTIEDVLKKG